MKIKKDKSKSSESKEQKQYIKDLGRDLNTKEKSKLGIGMIIIAIVLGFIGGFIV